MNQEFWQGEAALWALYGLCIEEACQAFCLNRTEMDILLFLANNPQFDTANQIVKHRRLSKSHVSTSLRSLQDRGYLAGACAQGDRRSIHLKLLPPSADAVQAGRQAQQRFQSVMLDGFAPEEQAQFQDYFRRVHENVRAHLNGGNKHGNAD